MVMKDKLIKNHRTGYFYKAKQIGLIFSTSLIALAIVIVPTYISFNFQVQNKASNAEDVEKNAEASKINETSLVSYLE